MGLYFIVGRVVFADAVVDPLALGTAPLLEAGLVACDSLARWAAIVRDKTRESILSSGSMAPR